MFDFLKQIFHNRQQDITFVLFDDEEPEASTSYRFKPRQLWNLFYGALVAVIVITLLLVMFTPLSSILYDREDAQLRERVIEVSKRVEAFKDSLNARNDQLSQMQKVIASGTDTTFTINESSQQLQNNGDQKKRELDFDSEVSTSGMLSQNEIIFSKILKKTPQFPTDYPIEGTFTRGYNPSDGHYGIDIATKQGTSFKAIADGAVINQDWTINYGFVLHVQHGHGIITVYKHASSLSKSIGDIVLKGDILGTAGDVGVRSTGPHLHIEIWKNGVPQNPNAYLLKS